LEPENDANCNSFLLIDLVLDLSSLFVTLLRYIYLLLKLVAFVVQDSLYISLVGKEGMHQAHENPVNFIDQLKQILI
jgi:hypothetical protein